MYITILASNEIFSPSNKIHREVGRAKDLSAPRYNFKIYFNDVILYVIITIIIIICVKKISFILIELNLINFSQVLCIYRGQVGRNMSSRILNPQSNKKSLNVNDGN
jgi:hypothetical protein